MRMNEGKEAGGKGRNAKENGIGRNASLLIS